MSRNFWREEGPEAITPTAACVILALQAKLQAILHWAVQAMTDGEGDFCRIAVMCA